MRKKIVAGNWKMNNDLQEGLHLTSEIVNMINDEVNDEVTVVLATSFVHLSGISKLLNGATNIFLGAQNCNEHVSGAYTGEVSATMLKSVHVDYVILGHSERREYFNETNELLTKKVNTVLTHGLLPIFCCGEPLEIRENETHFEFVCQQLTESLFHLKEEEMRCWTSYFGTQAISQPLKQTRETVH